MPKDKTTLGDMDKYDSGWVDPKHLYKDDAGDLWIDNAAPFQVLPSDTHLLRCERTPEGFRVDRWSCQNAPLGRPEAAPEELSKAIDTTAKHDD